MSMLGKSVSTQAIWFRQGKTAYSTPHAAKKASHGEQPYRRSAESKKMTVPHSNARWTQGIARYSGASRSAALNRSG